MIGRVAGDHRICGATQGENERAKIKARFDCAKYWRDIMTSSSTSSPNSIPQNDPQVVELKTSYNIPFVLITAGVVIAFLQIWVGAIIALFGIFLTIQAVTLRLQFTATDLDIYRSGKLIRRFPYVEWYNWHIFWTRVPILFYFKEINSIHFLPIIFDPCTLQEQLQKHCCR